jgi:hypothetical protein
LPSSALQKLSAAEAAASPVVAADSNSTTPSAAKTTRQSSKRRATVTTSNGAKRRARPTNAPVSQQSHSEAALEHETQDTTEAVPLDDAQVSLRTALMTSQLVQFVSGIASSLRVDSQAHVLLASHPVLKVVFSALAFAGL